MSLRRLLGASSRAAARARMARGGGDHGHGPMMPPFARQQPPKNPVHREMELVWDDSVSPEPAIDFEGASISTREVLGMFAAAFGSLFVLYNIIDFGDPKGSNPAAPRETVIPEPNALRAELGFEVSADEE